MTNLISLFTKGLGGSVGNIILLGLSGSETPVIEYSGFYHGARPHKVIKILQRGLEVRQLYYRTEEVCPMVVLVESRTNEESIPIKVAKLNSENIEAKVLVSTLATEYIEIPVMIAHPTTISIEAKVPIAVSQEESILGCLNIYDETEWAKMKPTAVFSIRELEIKSLDDIWFRPVNKLEIIKSKELEFVRK